VTADNFEHLVDWVGHAATSDKACPRNFMWVADTQAYEGYWIVKEANGAFNVYTDEEFRLMHEVD